MERLDLGNQLFPLQLRNTTIFRKKISLPLPPGSNSDIFFLSDCILRQVIASAILDDMTILDTKTNQLEKLNSDTVSEVAAFLPSRLVVVIDVLDECDPDNTASDIIQLLMTSLSS